MQWVAVVCVGRFRLTGLSAKEQYIGGRFSVLAVYGIDILMMIHIYINMYLYDDFKRMSRQQTESRSRLKAGIEYFRNGDFESAYQQLEDAHILGQSLVVEHALSHWWMFRVAWKTQDFREAAGQIPRILASILFSKIWVPAGNSGRAGVSALRPMPVPDHLKEFLS